jgi:hypothetical protein
MKMVWKKEVRNTVTIIDHIIKDIVISQIIKEVAITITRVLIDTTIIMTERKEICITIIVIIDIIIDIIRG